MDNLSNILVLALLVLFLRLVAKKLAYRDQRREAESLKRHVVREY
jgi:hypothetical protein